MCKTSVQIYFFRVALLLYDIQYMHAHQKTQCTFIVDITSNDHTLYFFAVFLDLKKIEHKLNHHQQIGLK